MATPTLVQHVVYAGNGSQGTVNAVELNLPNATLAGNCLILAVRRPSSGTITSVIGKNAAGTTVDTWSTTPFKTVTDSGNAVKLDIMILPNGGGGVVQIVYTLNAAKDGLKFAFQEWCNIATSSETDGGATEVNSLSASGQAITSGSFTTTTAGDLILQFGQSTDWGTEGWDGYYNGFSLYTKGTGYNFLEADLVGGYFCQSAIQATAGAVNPSATVTQTTSGYTVLSITIALKAAAAGTPPPSTVYCVGVYHNRVIGSGAAGDKTYPVQFPTFGNTFVATFTDPTSAIELVGVSGAVSGTWTVVSSSGEDSQGAYVTGATASTAELLTFTIDDETDHLYIQGCIYDWANGGAFDASQHTDTSTTFSGNSNPTVSFTPGVSSGFVVGVAGINTGPPNAMVQPSGAQFISTYATGMNDGSWMDNGDLHAIYPFASAAAQTWQFYNTASTTGYDMLLMSFAGAGGGASPIAALAGSPSSGQAPLTGAGVLMGLATAETTATTQLGAPGEISSLGASLSTGQAQPAGAGAATALGASATKGIADAAGSGALTSLGAAPSSAQAALQGAGAVTARGDSQTSATADLTGGGALNANGAAVSVGLAQPKGSGTLTTLGIAPSAGIATLSGSNPGAFGFLAVAMTANAEQPGTPITDYVNAPGVSASVATVQATGALPAGLLAITESAAFAQLSGAGKMAALAAMASRASVSLTGAGAMSASGVTSTGATAPLAGPGATGARGVSATIGQAPLAGAGALSAQGISASLAVNMLGGAMPLSVHGASMTAGPGHLTASFALSALGVSGTDGRMALAGAGAITARATSATTGLIQPRGAAQIGMSAISATCAAVPLAIASNLLTACGVSMSVAFSTPQNLLFPDPRYVVSIRIRNFTATIPSRNFTAES